MFLDLNMPDIGGLRGHRVRTRPGQAPAVADRGAHHPGRRGLEDQGARCWALRGSSPSRSFPTAIVERRALAGRRSRSAGDPGSLDAREFIAGYLVEVDEHLASANKNLLAVEADLKRGRGQPSRRCASSTGRCTRSRGCRPWSASSRSSTSRTPWRTSCGRPTAVGGKLDDASFDLLMKGLAALEQRVRAVARNESRSLPRRPSWCAICRPSAAPREASAERPSDELPLARRDRRQAEASSERAQLAAGPFGTGVERCASMWCPRPPASQRDSPSPPFASGVAALGEIVKVRALAPPACRRRSRAA